MNVENISYRKYKHSDFEKVFKIFVEFQAKAKIRYYHNISKDQQLLFSLPYLARELKNLTTKHKYNYVGVNKENGDIIAYACFDESVIIEGHIDLVLVFKDEKIPFNKLLKFLILLVMKKEFPNKRIFAALGQRDRFDKYLNFVKRVFKANVMSRDAFGNVYVEFSK